MEEPKIRKVVTQATELAKSQNWSAEAIQANMSVATSPDVSKKERVAAYSRLGRCHAVAGKFHTARCMFGKALELAPECLIASKGFNRCEDLPDYPGVEEINCPIQLIELGRGLMAYGEKDLIKAVIAKSESLASSVYELNTLGGFLRNEMKAPARARRAYEKALKIVRNPVSIVGDAACLSDLNLLDEAERKLLPIVNEFPDNDYALNCMARVYWKQGRRNEAEELFSRANQIEAEQMNASTIPRSARPTNA